MRLSAAPRITASTKGLLLLALVLLVGCVPGTRDLDQEIARIKAQKGVPVDPLPPMKEYEPFPYAVYNQRDPFSPFSGEAPATGAGDDGASPDTNRVKEPLESFPLDALNMVGTMGNEAGMVALVKDPDGVVHRLTVDNYMGQNEGRITAIYEDHVDLVELVQNGTGGWVERPAAIALNDG
jgi:type IV pilus assembly protein PilP